ncbi:hypothetical protein BFC17_02230 [Alteromonas lipolytica]|uniref:Uncharacterized protein n=1 Tax=Alteromonas lipolytica TaxID=1856405 RepID=A0A1E8FDC5_9ALTE|nr:hypothetical protein BFC17_02230 [Alteromonas lipolytica]
MADFHLQALTLAEQGQWDTAHDLVEAHNDEFSCLIHGYLHRVEGDEFNARYWYTRAGHTMPENRLNEELERLKQLVVQSS